jgi:hypothetical protein
VVYCTGLENRRAERSRGFESLSLRQVRFPFALLVELVDTTDLKSVAARRAGSSPAGSTRSLKFKHLRKTSLSEPTPLYCYLCNVGTLIN